MTELGELNLLLKQIADGIATTEIEYDYAQTFRDKPYVIDGKEYEPLSVETMRTQGWKVHSAYGTTDGDLYHILRRPRDNAAAADGDA